MQSSLGEFDTARILFERCPAMSEPEHRARYVALTGADQYVVMLVYFGMTLMYLGQIDQGRTLLKDAVSRARQLRHAFTLAFMLNLAGLMEQVARLPREAHQYAEEQIALSNEHGFPTWLGAGMVIRGWALAELTRAQEGLEQCTQGLSVYRATGAIFHTGGRFLICLGEIYAKLGSIVEGLNCVSEARRIIDMTDEREHEAELNRLHGDLLLATGDEPAADRAYHQARIVAKRQNAKFWEVRAATSLARLWRDQGKRTEARDILAPVYNWFTEGFDTANLKDAKALLDELTS